MAAMAPVRTGQAAQTHEHNEARSQAGCDCSVEEPELEPKYKVWAPQHWM